MLRSLPKKKHTKKTKHDLHPLGWGFPLFHCCLTVIFRTIADNADGRSSRTLENTIKRSVIIHIKDPSSIQDKVRDNPINAWATMMLRGLGMINQAVSAAAEQAWVGGPPRSSLSQTTLPDDGEATAGTAPARA